MDLTEFMDADCLPPQAVWDLLEAMFRFHPGERPPACELLLHPAFAGIEAAPLPVPAGETIEMAPSPTVGTHGRQKGRRREKERKKEEEEQEQKQEQEDEEKFKNAAKSWKISCS